MRIRYKDFCIYAHLTMNCRWMPWVITDSLKSLHKNFSMTWLFTPLTIAYIFLLLFQIFNPAATAPLLVFSQRIITSPNTSIWCWIKNVIKADWEPKLQVLTCISSQTVKSRPLLLVTVSNFLYGGIRFSSWGCLFSSYGCAKSVALLESVLVNYSRLTVGVDAVNGKSDESIAAFIFWSSGSRAGINSRNFPCT